MHELSLVKSLLQQVKPYQDRPIKKVVLEVGTMTCVDPERLVFCFDMVKEEAGLSDANLQINMQQAIAKCQQCDREFKLQQLGQPCECGSYHYTIGTGRDLNLIEIEFNDV